MNPSRIVVPVVILLTGALIAWWLLATAPEPKRKEQVRPELAVETLTVKPRDYTISIHSQGTVSPRTSSDLVAEVAGRVLAVADNFTDGGYFEEGDELLSIDPTDYESAVAAASAELAQKELALKQEEAQAAQALQEWKRLKKGGKPDDLVLRKPQLASAKASAMAARARLAQARADLKRTHVKAPYVGRIEEKKVDVGQYVSRGTALASIYAIDYAEIKLPLTEEALAWLKIPEQYRGESGKPGPPVTLRKGGHVWNGRVVRSSGVVDARSRQLFAIAQVDNPYGRSESGQPPLKIGSFVEASIEGETLRNVMVIPRSALRENNQVLVVQDGKLHVQPVEIIWSGKDEIVAGAGLKTGDQVITSPIAYIVEGEPVSVSKNE